MLTSGKHVKDIFSKRTFETKRIPRCSDASFQLKIAIETSSYRVNTRKRRLAHLFGNSSVRLFSASADKAKRFLPPHSAVRSANGIPLNRETAADAERRVRSHCDSAADGFGMTRRTRTHLRHVAVKIIK